MQELSPAERHKLRIKVKKLRYAVESFASLYSSKREKKDLAGMSVHLKKVQRTLGTLNDFAADRDMLARSALNAPRQHRRARALMSGVILGREQEAAHPLLDTAQRELSRVRI